MSAANEHADEIAVFPEPLRALIEAELAAGNAIAEVSHSWPAPPVGAAVKLERPVTTRPQADGGGLTYYARNCSLHSGEFTDAQKFFWVLEPPKPPPDPNGPDMDTIREAANTPAPPPTFPPPSPGDDAVLRFERSMQIDYDRWHDGIGYDLDAIRNADDDERRRIEAIMLRRGADDWRDVEAMAALDTPATDKMLRNALRMGNAEIRNAVTQHAPHLVSDDERTRTLIAGLDDAVIYGGLTSTLDGVAEHHPPAVIDALLRNALRREGQVAIHLAAMAMYLHGKADEPFDWNHRPFFLRFAGPGAPSPDRIAVFRELCEKIGVDAERHLRLK